MHYLSADHTPVGLVYEPLGRLANPVTGAKASAAAAVKISIIVLMSFSATAIESNCDEKVKVIWD